MTDSGPRRRLSERIFAFPLLLVSLLLLPVAASARADNPISVADTIGDKFFPRYGYSRLQPTFRGNSIRLYEFMRRVSKIHADSTTRLNSIDIVAYASPEGPYTLNKKLARKRAENISAYLRGNMPFLSGSLFNVQLKGIDWNGLAAMVEASDMRYRSGVLNIHRNVPETTYRNGKLVDSRLKRLMDLRGGRPYNYMLTYFFPELRAAGAYAVCDFVSIIPAVVPDTVPTEPVEIVEPVYIKQTDTVVPLPADTIQVQISQSSFKDYDRRAIKSNALYLAAGVANVGGEYAFHPHWSVDLPLVYSPHTISRRYPTSGSGACLPGLSNVNSNNNLTLIIT